MVSRKRKTYRKRKFRKRGYKRRYRRKSVKNRKFAKSKVQNWTRWCNVNTMTIGAGTTSFLRSSIRYQDIPGVAEITNVYRYYRIKYFAIEWQVPGTNLAEPYTATGNVDPATGATTLSINPLFVAPLYMHTCSVGSWDGGPTSLPGMREVNTYRRKTMRHGYNMFFEKYPKWMTEIAEGLTGTAEVDRRSGWITTARPGVVHYGRLIGIENLAAVNQTLNYRYKVYLQLKGLK